MFVGDAWNHLVCNVITHKRLVRTAESISRGLGDAITSPEELRPALILALETSLNTSTPHISAFVLPNI